MSCMIYIKLSKQLASYSLHLCLFNDQTHLQLLLCFCQYRSQFQLQRLGNIPLDMKANHSDFLW